jgi:hypothetical protein
MQFIIVLYCVYSILLYCGEQNNNELHTLYYALIQWLEVYYTVMYSIAHYLL